MVNFHTQINHYDNHSPPLLDLFASSNPSTCSGISITESLTKKRMQMLNKARNEFLFKNVLTQDGKILFTSIIISIYLHQYLYMLKYASINVQYQVP